MIYNSPYKYWPAERGQCELCEYASAAKQDLNKHIQAVHEGKKNFKCDICDTRFSRKDSMNRHISLVHENNKPHKWKLCEY